MTQNRKKFNPSELETLNNVFKAFVNDLFPSDYEQLVQWLQSTFDIKNRQSVDAWFGKERFSRKFISKATKYDQKLARIAFAQAFCGLIATNQPIDCKDFFLNPLDGQKGREKFKEYINDGYVQANVVSIIVENNKLTLCYKSYPDADEDSNEPVDMNSPFFDAFRVPGPRK